MINENFESTMNNEDNFKHTIYKIPYSSNKKSPTDYVKKLRHFTLPSSILNEPDHNISQN